MLLPLLLMNGFCSLVMMFLRNPRADLGKLSCEASKADHGMVSEWRLVRGHHGPRFEKIFVSIQPVKSGRHGICHCGVISKVK